MESFTAEAVPEEKKSKKQKTPMRRMAFIVLDINTDEIIVELTTYYCKKHLHYIVYVQVKSIDTFFIMVNTNITKPAAS